MNEGTRSGKSTIRLLGISAERPTNGLYLLLLLYLVLITETNCVYCAVRDEYLNIIQVDYRMFCVDKRISVPSGNSFSSSWIRLLPLSVRE
jgi:hypothetical protein